LDLEKENTEDSTDTHKIEEKEETNNFHSAPTTPVEVTRSDLTE
jgi:hypothetical protein